MLKGIMDNKMIRNALMSKAKKLAIEEGVKMITIEITDTGEMDFKIYKEKQILMTVHEFNKLINEKI